jgi:hypothetical protein
MLASAQEPAPKRVAVRLTRAQAWRPLGHPNPYRCLLLMAGWRAVACARAVAGSKPAGAARKTCVLERLRALLPPYSRRYSGLTHAQFGQVWSLFEQPDDLRAFLEPFRLNAIAVGTAQKASPKNAVYTGGAAKIRTFGSVNSSTAKATPSRPMPESFMPPYG